MITANQCILIYDTIREVKDLIASGKITTGMELSTHIYNTKKNDIWGSLNRVLGCTYGNSGIYHNTKAEWRVTLDRIYGELLEAIQGLNKHNEVMNG